MNTTVLRSIGLTENEIKIYLYLLKKGTSTAYTIAKDTGIYRVHVYDKLEQLMNKGLVNQVYEGAKKYFAATHPSKLKQYLEDKRKKLTTQEQEVETILPELEKLMLIPKEDTSVEVFKGKEGLKYFLKDIVKTKKDVAITGMDDTRYRAELPVFMKQYFRDLTKHKIKERVITVKKEEVYLYPKKEASTTRYRFLEEKKFNPTNTFIYGEKVVIVTWGTPITAVMIKSKQVATTYRKHFEILWDSAKKK